MRIRKHYAAAFAGMLLITAVVTFTPTTIPQYKQSDKLVHLLVLLILTSTFYWIVDTSRRRNLQITLFVCAGLIGVGSEFLLAVVDPESPFDIFDVIANLLGAVAGTFLSAWYHRRLIFRQRTSRAGYQRTAADDSGDDSQVELSGLESGPGRQPSMDGDDGSINSPSSAVLVEATPDLEAFDDRSRRP